MECKINEMQFFFIMHLSDSEPVKGHEIESPHYMKNWHIRKQQPEGRKGLNVKNTTA